MNEAEVTMIIHLCEGANINRVPTVAEIELMETTKNPKYLDAGQRRVTLG